MSIRSCFDPFFAFFFFSVSISHFFLLLLVLFRRGKIYIIDHFAYFVIVLLTVPVKKPLFAVQFLFWFPPISLFSR